MLLHWSDIYRTGHPEIDKQHKQIIETMNDFHQAVMERKGSEAVKEVMNFLNGYIKDHFSYEELCMSEFRCPYAEKNRSAHKAFMKLIEQTKSSYEGGEMNHGEVMDFYYDMVYWIKDHILEIDRQNFNCVRAALREKFSGEPEV